MKTEVSVSILLTSAMSLLTLGVSFLEKGDSVTGVACIIVGFGLIVTTVILLERGIIEGIKKESSTRLIEQVNRRIEKLWQ
jgi:hypothetical protein